MLQRNAKQTDLGFFFFASFGAASILVLLTTLFLSFLFSFFGTDISFSAILWVFLFLFPAALAFALRFVASKLGSIETRPVVYSIIVGYGTYSVISLFILLVGGRNEPALWALLVLTLVTVAILNADSILARFGIREEVAPDDQRETRVVNVSPFTLPIKINSDSKEGKENQKPIFSIKNRSESQEKKDSETIDMHGADAEVIHLGPRS